MLYKEFKPRNKLKKIVKCFWILEHDYLKTFHKYEHIWADAYPELIFTSGKPYYQISNSQKHFLDKTLVIGTFKKSFKLYSDGLTKLIAVRFQPWGLYPFSKKTIKDLINSILPAYKVFGKTIEHIVNFKQNKSSEENIEILQDYLSRVFLQTDKKLNRSKQIASYVIANRGIIKIADLSRQFDISQRQIARVFEKEIGLSAKMFSKIVRFNYSKHLIERNPDIDLTQLAYKAGYSDQSHFNKNFRELFDITPSQFKTKIKTFLQETSHTNLNVQFLQD